MKLFKRYYWIIVIIAAFIIAMAAGQCLDGTAKMTTPKARGEYHNENLF